MSLVGFLLCVLSKTSHIWCASLFPTCRAEMRGWLVHLALLRLAFMQACLCHALILGHPSKYLMVMTGVSLVHSRSALMTSFWTLSSLNIWIGDSVKRLSPWSKPVITRNCISRKSAWCWKPVQHSIILFLCFLYWVVHKYLKDSCQKQHPVTLSIDPSQWTLLHYTGGSWLCRFCYSRSN